MLKNKALAAAPSAVPQYIEDVFSTYLYTGNGTSQTIINGIDLAGKGGMVWIKGRSGATDHALYDTARGVTKDLVSNSAAAETTQSTGLTAFNNNGFNISSLAKLNTSAATYASWTFRKAPKFFDVVTYTGNGVDGRMINHSLGSRPGMVIVKCTSHSSNWIVWHRSLTAGGVGAFGTNRNAYLNLTLAAGNEQDFSMDGNQDFTSTQFPVSATTQTANTNGRTYVAYLFAHDAGGFGDAGDQSVVSCGSYTGNGSATGPVVTLGWEPQYVLVKNISAESEWYVFDNMRGQSYSGCPALYTNRSYAEDAFSFPIVVPTATGFKISSSMIVNTSGSTYIYLAIRRGPMKTPTSGTSVFHTDLGRDIGSSTTPSYIAPITVDLALQRFRTAADDTIIASRLQGETAMRTNTTAAESAYSSWAFDYQTGWGEIAASNANYVSWMFRRAPGFFDVVCYTGTGLTQNVSHSLGVVPELIIVKSRSSSGTFWMVYHPSLGKNGAFPNYVALNESNAKYSGASSGFAADPTSSVFAVGGAGDWGGSGQTYVAYLFATLPGVSKVGSYTGTGTTQQINCGFTTGARFVLIKRTDSTGGWYTYDTARGISTSNDPYLLLNSTAAEVTNTDYIDPLASGFEISSTAPAEINANGGTFIYLAIA